MVGRCCYNGDLTEYNAAVLPASVPLQAGRQGAGRAGIVTPMPLSAYGDNNKGIQNASGDHQGWTGGHLRKKTLPMLTTAVGRWAKGSLTEPHAG